MPGVPYRAVWSDISPRPEYAVLAGHTGSVRSLCTVTMPGETLLASSSWDGTVRIWDPLTGTARHTLRGGSVTVCAFTLAGHPLLAGIDVQGPVRVWDPISGAPYSVLDGHTGWNKALYAVEMWVADRRHSRGSAHAAPRAPWSPGLTQRQARRVLTYRRLPTVKLSLRSDSTH
ncbi:MAG: hypothetical protein ACRDRI_01315 [Pseudonocardiaceae bacterium]